MPATPRYLSASINVATAADQTIVAAVAGQAIQIVGLVLVAAGAVTVTPKDGTTALTGPISLIAGTPLILIPERAIVP